MGKKEVERFLSDLAVQRDVAASTQNQAFGAILFLYRDVLGIKLDWLDSVVRAKMPKRVPVVLTCDEVTAVFMHLSGVNLIAANLMYGAGLRLLEVHYRLQPTAPSAVTHFLALWGKSVPSSARSSTGALCGPNTFLLATVT